MMSDLDQAIVFALTTLKDDAAKLTSALMANTLTDKERAHLARRFAVLADVLNERAELMRKHASNNSARHDASGGDAG